VLRVCVEGAPRLRVLSVVVLLDYGRRRKTASSEILDRRVVVVMGRF